MAWIFQILSRFLFGSLIFSMIMLVLSVATSIRMFPRLVKLIHRFLRSFLILSYRLYDLILAALQPAIFRWFDTDIFQGNFRLMFCVLFSLIIGVLPMALLDPSWSLWILVFCVLHGLFIGLAWDDIENPGGIQFGRRVP